MTIDLVEPQQVRPARLKTSSATTQSRLSGLIGRLPALRDGMLSIVDQAIVSGASFASAVIIGRATSLDQLGLYYLTLTIVGLLTDIHVNVVSVPYTMFCGRHRGRDLLEYTASTWAHHLGLTVATTLGLLAAITVATIAGAVEILPGLWMVLGVGPLLVLREGIRYFSLAHLQLPVMIAMDATVAVLQLASLLLLSRLGMLSIVTIFSVMGGACGLACFGWFLFKPQSVRLVRGRVLQDWLENWSFAKWALTCHLVGSTTPYIVPWILTVAMGPAPTGVLGACRTLVGIVGIFILGSCNVLTPKAAQALASGGVPSLRRTLDGTAMLFALVLGTFCLATFLTGDRLPVLVYGGQFVGSGAILAALALNMLISGLGMVAGKGLWALGQPRANILSDICTLVVTLVAAFCLVVPYGVLGAALAMLIGTSTGTLLRMVTLRATMISFPVEANARFVADSDQ